MARWMASPASVLRALAAFALTIAMNVALAADPIAEITHASGVVSVKRGDAPPRLIGAKSALFAGDQLTTEADTYVRIRFKDGAQTVLRPNTQFVIKAYDYDPQRPEEDNAAVSLLKGGMRAVTGALGQRSKDKLIIEAPTATIGIRGTEWGALFCAQDCGAYRDGNGQVPQDGLHVDVTNGAIIVRNPQGVQDFGPGQFGFVGSNAPPILVPPTAGVRSPLPPAFRRPNAPTGPGVGKNGDASCRI